MWLYTHAQCSMITIEKAAKNLIYKHVAHPDYGRKIKHFLTFLGNIKKSHDDLMFKQQQRKNPATEARDRESSLLQNVPVPSYIPINTPGDYFNGAVSVRSIQNLIKMSVTVMKSTAPFCVRQLKNVDCNLS